MLDTHTRLVRLAFFPESYEDVNAPEYSSGSWENGETRARFKLVINSVITCQRDLLKLKLCWTLGWTAARAR
jgi:hypothetical protein